VRWLAGASSLRTISVEATPRIAGLCPGVSADVGGGASASAELQRCIDSTPSGSTLELPAGVYRITSEVRINRPILLRTRGTAGLSGCAESDGPSCAVLRADDNLNVPRGFLRLDPATSVTLDHIVLDGNRDKRLASAAGARCASGLDNGAGMNAHTERCVGCSFTNGMSARALCGTGWEWIGDQATITGSVFRDNGAHTVQNMWADGLTLLRGNGARITGNRFIDNSDVDLIFGGGTDAVVQGNAVLHLVQGAFAGIMLDNFGGSTSGDFTNSTVSGNAINCGGPQCDYAIQLGGHPWYLSPNLIGGTVSGNSAFGGKFGLNVDGAGTTAAPMVVTGNTIGASSGSAAFLCGSRSVTTFNVSSDSVVDLKAGPAPTGTMTVHLCP
jgi:hypothetical protein